MINTISKNGKYYRAFTDLIEVNVKLICVFSEMNKDSKKSNIFFGKSVDNSIYVTAHIVDDNPVAQIRGYKFKEKDLIIK